MQTSMTTQLHSEASCDNNPLVTIAILAYNQEHYIREAIQGAFCQSYQPLQIIISDDCSTDATFEIIEDMTSSYKGHHSILISKNAVNIGIIRHVEHIMTLAQGRLIVLAAGDDISLPERVANVVDTWIKKGMPPSSIFSHTIRISETGEPLGSTFTVPADAVYAMPRIQDRDIRVFWSFPGCTQAFTKESFSLFGPIDSSIVAEDRVLQFRSALLGELLFVDKSLVKYRQTNNSQSRSSLEGKAGMRHRADYEQGLTRVLRQFARDANRAFDNKIIDQETYHWLEQMINLEIKKSERIVAFYGAKSIIKRLLALWSGLGVVELTHWMRWLLYFMIPGAYNYRNNRFKWRTSRSPKVRSHSAGLEP